MDNLKFSPSRYNLAKDCPGKYYFRYIEKIEVENKVWPGTVFGTTLHLFIEENLNELRGKNLKKEVKRDFLSCWNDSKIEALSQSKSKWSLPRGYVEADYLKEGEEWCLKVLKHLYNWLPKESVKVFEEENKIEFIRGDRNILFNSIIDMQLTYEDKLRIIDFKTTKYPQNYFFVRWESDPQSLSYLFLKRDQRPESFSYNIFDKNSKMIFVNKRSAWRDEEESNFLSLVDNFIKIHDVAADERIRRPEKEKCHWCEYSKLCKVAIKK